MFFREIINKRPVLRRHFASRVYHTELYVATPTRRIDSLSTSPIRNNEDAEVTDYISIASRNPSHIPNNTQTVTVSEETM